MSASNGARLRAAEPEIEVNDNVQHSFADDASRPRRPRPFETIMYGGLLVGVLDAFDAMILSGLHGGVSPSRVWQFVASGVLGRAAFSGGMKTVLLGLLIHFLIAFVLAGIYYGASLSFPMLLRRAVLWGSIYGAAVYFVMRYIVTPLSAAPPLSFSVASLLNGVIGHALLVGLPIALIARRSQK